MPYFIVIVAEMACEAPKTYTISEYKCPTGQYPCALFTKFSAWKSIPWVYLFPQI